MQASHSSKPFDHWVIDGFFDVETAKELSADFYEYDDGRWLTRHDNELESKRISTHWDWYPKSIYSAFYYLNSNEFISELEQITGISGLIPDYGLHAGGMHIHASGSGRLNLHQDAELHPKLGLKRKLNLIVYLNPKWEEDWGGNLELWSAAPDGSPLSMVESISPLFNRAVIFDTTQNSWHGIPDSINSPANENRISIALFYYIKNDVVDTPQRLRALFAPTETQKSDLKVLKQIEERATKTVTWDGN